MNPCTTSAPHCVCPDTTRRTRAIELSKLSLLALRKPHLVVPKEDFDRVMA